MQVVTENGHLATGHAAQGSAPVPRRSARYTVVAVDHKSPGRADLEQFVAAAFLRKHGARIRSFMPTLLGLQSAAGTTCGVAGYRLASRENLYLEQYFDAPIEAILSRRLAADVSRDEIVEIGNLASVNCRSARHLVGMLPGYLLDQGQRWVVFTATNIVREILESVGAPLHDLGTADGARVRRAPDEWGAYYATDPHVMAGYLPAGLDLRLRHRH